MNTWTGTYPPRPDGRSQHTQDVRIRLEHGFAVQEVDLGPWVIVGHCPRCGMPMFVNRQQINSERPPYVHRTCKCFHRKEDHRSKWT